MKVLITGAGGQLGRALVETAPAGMEVSALGRSDLDITDPAAATAAAAGCDLIVNAAAYTAVDRAESDPDAAFACNARAVTNLARTGVRLIQLSTDFVFDGHSNRPYRADDRTGPQSVYGASKLAGEGEALAGTDALVVRTAWVYDHQGRNFMRTMLRLMNESGSVRVVADQVGTPTSAVSLAAAIWALGARGAVGVHHYTDAGAASWYDFAVAIREEGVARGLCPAGAAVTPIRTEDYPTPAPRPAYSVLDKTDTWALIGPARHWREELRATLDRMAAHG